MKIQLKKFGGALVPVDEKELEKLNTFKNAVYIVDIKNSDTRSSAQNAAIHLWCTQIAKTLNQSNLPQSKILRAEIDWNMEKVKEVIFKPIVKALYNKNSTTKLDKKEFEKIIDTIVITFASRGVTIPSFPNKEALN